jgi:hypothetical protein
MRVNHPSRHTIMTIEHSEPSDNGRFSAERANCCRIQRAGVQLAMQNRGHFKPNCANKRVRTQDLVSLKRCSIFIILILQASE